MKKIFSLLIFFVIFAAASSHAISLEKQTSSKTSYGNVLYVGGNGTGNYTNIQDAIDDAISGDTIFVFDDSSPYYENLIINKSISLIGENKKTTIIDGSGANNIVLIRLADYVQLRGFTIRNSSRTKINFRYNYY